MGFDPATIGLVISAVSAGGAAYSASQSGKVKAPPSVPPPPALQQPDTTAGANSMQQRAKASVGAGATSVTGPQGLSGSESTAGKTLLGN